MKKVMKCKTPYCLFLTTLLLSACGGGGSSDNSTVSGPKVILHLGTSDVKFVSHEGDALPVVFEGTWSSSNLEDNVVYIKLVDDSGEHISTVMSGPLESDRFTLNTVINHQLQAGEYTPTISFVACKDSNCSSVYADSKISLRVEINVEPVPEWQTHQANASHNGYVPIWLSSYSFDKMWEWEREPSSDPIGGINSPVAGNGEVYVSTDVYFGDSAVIALDELTGEERWRVPFGIMPALNPPAINNETLFVSTSGHEDTKVWAIDRALGQLKFQTNFSSQWGHYLAPTVYGNMVFQTGGYYGGDTYAFSIETGEQAWSQSLGTSWGMDTPAVDEEKVYVHNGNELSVFDKESGEIISTITDPSSDTSGHDYHGAPVIGGRNNILAYSGGAFSGRASSNAEHYEDRVISSFDVINGEHVWSTQSRYKTFFAISNGVVYAGKNSPVALDAIDEATGEVLWSWVPPSSEDTSFHRNIIVTKNVLFVSTNANLYAIDLKTKEAVWSYAEPGMISISDNRILFLAPGATRSDGRLIAFDLR